MVGVGRITIPITTPAITALRFIRAIPITRQLSARLSHHRRQIGTIATILRAITPTYRVAITNGRLSRLFRLARAWTRSRQYPRQRCRQHKLRLLFFLRGCRMGLLGTPAGPLSPTQGEHKSDTFGSGRAVDVLTHFARRVPSSARVTICRFGRIRTECAFRCIPDLEAGPGNREILTHFGQSAGMRG